MLLEDRKGHDLAPALAPRHHLEDAREGLLPDRVIALLVQAIQEYGAVDVVEGPEALALEVEEDPVLEVVERVGPKLQLAPRYRPGRG